MLKRFMRRNKRQAPPDRPQAKGSSGPEATDSDGREAAQEDADRGTAENEPERPEESAASGAGASASEHTGEDGPAGDEAPEDDRGQGTQNGDASEERRQGQDRRDPSRGDGPAGARRRVNVEEPEANEGPELGDPKLLPHLRAFARRAEAVRESDPHALLERAVAGLHELGDLLGQPLSLEDVLPALLDGPWRLRSALEERERETARVEQKHAARTAELERAQERNEEHELEMERLHGEITELEQRGDARSQERDDARAEAEERAEETVRIGRYATAIKRKLRAVRVGARKLAHRNERLCRELEIVEQRDASDWEQVQELVLALHRAAGEPRPSAEQEPRPDPQELPAEMEDEPGSDTAAEATMTLEVGQECLERILAELEWRREEMDLVRGNFEKAVWRLAGGAVRRVRSWSDHEQPTGPVGSRRTARPAQPASEGSAAAPVPDEPAVDEDLHDDLADDAFDVDALHETEEPEGLYETGEDDAADETPEEPESEDTGALEEESQP